MGEDDYNEDENQIVEQMRKRKEKMKKQGENLIKAINNQG